MGSKRGQNEGSIYWDESRERWRAAITVDGRRKFFSGKTRREVQKQLLAAQHALEEGILHVGPNMLLSDYLNAWIENTRTQVRPRTWVRYHFDVQKKIIPALGTKPLDKLTAADLTTLYGKLSDAGLAPRTVRNVHRVLHKALADAVNSDPPLLQRNVADKAKPPRADEPQRRWFSLDEAKKLMLAAKEDPFGALYILALTTGMREAELLGLQWDCVDLDKGTVSIVRTACTVEGKGVIWGDPKTARSRRRISLTSVAIDALRTQQAQIARERAAAGDRWEDNNLVFPNAVGKPINRNNLLQRYWYPFQERAGLPRIRFHDLRHSAASLLCSMGTSPKVVQEILGHSSITVTMDMYSHLLPTMQAAAIDTLNDALCDQQ